MNPAIPGRRLQMTQIGLHRSEHQRRASRLRDRRKPGSAHRVRSDRPARCRCRGPRCSRCRRAVSLADASAARSTACCAGPLGTVSPLLAPSWLTAEPRTTASTGSPSRSASVSRLSTTTPQPSLRTYPSAPASKVLHWPSGDSMPHREQAMLVSGLEHQVGSADQRHVAFPPAQALAGQVDRPPATTSTRCRGPPPGRAHPGNRTAARRRSSPSCRSAGRRRVLRAATGRPA